MLLEILRYRCLGYTRLFSHTIISGCCETVKISSSVYESKMQQMLGVYRVQDNSVQIYPKYKHLDGGNIMQAGYRNGWEVVIKTDLVAHIIIVCLYL